MVAVAIGGAAVVGAGASVVAGSKAAGAQKDAANTAAAASDRATQAQIEEARRQYDQTRGDYAPYREAGYGALSKLQDMYGLTPQTASGSTISTSSSTPWATGVDDGAYKKIADTAPGGVDWAKYVQNNPDAAAQWASQTPDLASFGGDVNKFGAFHYENDGARRDLTPYKTNASAPGGTVTGKTTIPGPDYSDIGNAPDYSDIGSSPNYSHFTESPGYQFRLQRGLDAVKANASARGLLGSTKTMKGIDSYAEGMAAQEYDAFYNRTKAAYDDAYSRKTAAFDARYNRTTSAYDAYANRLAALAGVGQTATGQTATAGSQASNAISNAYGQNGTNQANAAINAGNATASGYANLGSAVNTATTNLASLYLYQNGGGFGSGAGGSGGMSFNRIGMI